MTCLNVIITAANKMNKSQTKTGAVEQWKCPNYTDTQALHAFNTNININPRILGTKSCAGTDNPIFQLEHSNLFMFFNNRSHWHA